MQKVLLVTTALLASIILTSCGASEVTESSRGSLGDLQDTEELRTLFNQDDGEVRVILLLSPT